MPGKLAIGFGVKGLFFDSSKVLKAVDDATYRAFLRFGQYARKVARHSIRSRPGAAAPGRPPHSHIGLLKEFIFYSFDPAQRSVIIGPARLQNTQAYGPTTVPELLEHGGVVSPTRHSRYGDGARGRDSKMRHYEARPYMGPAFERSQDKLNDFWRDSVR